MKSIAVLCLLMGACVLLSGEQEVDLSTPRATFDTFINAALNKNKDLCIYCVAQPLKQEIAEEFDDLEVPDELDYDVVSEAIEGDVACLTIEARIVMDGQEEKATENFWFVKEEDGWKLIEEPPDEREEFDSTKMQPER